MVNLSSNLIYSSAYFKDRTHEFYHLFKKNNYDENIKDYIEGLEFRSCNWEILFNEFKDIDNVIWICDPPYLLSDKGGYQIDNNCWTVYDNLNILKILKTPSYIYYTSTKSGIFDILKFLNENGLEYSESNKIVYKRRQINKLNVDVMEEIILYHFA